MRRNGAASPAPTPPSSRTSRTKGFLLKVAVTGATGTIGRAVIAALVDRADQVVALSRRPESARSKLPAGVDAVAWPDPVAAPPPTDAFIGVDAVVHLAGEPVDQRWNDESKAAIRDSRVAGTRNLVAAIAEAGAALKTLVSASA